MFSLRLWSSQQLFELPLPHIRLAFILLLLLHIRQKQIIQLLTNFIQRLFHFLLFLLLLQLPQLTLINLNAVANVFVRIVIRLFYQAQNLFRIRTCCLKWKIFGICSTCCTWHGVHLMMLYFMKVVMLFKVWLWMLTRNTVLVWKYMLELDLVVKTLWALTRLWSFYAWCIFSYHVLWLVWKLVVHIFWCAIWVLILPVAFTLYLRRIRCIWRMILVFLRI